MTFNKFQEEKPLTVDLNDPHDNQKLILKSKAKYRVVSCGRRFGKSEAAKIATNIRAVQGQGIWFCSPTNKNSKRMFRQFEKLYKNFPEHLVKINKTDMRIDFIFSDGWIEFISLAEPDNLRGEGLDFVVIDEAAFVADHVWSEILQPMLLSTKGDALFISSTNGRNWFWRIYNMGLDPDVEDYEAFHFTTYDNPLLDKLDIDKIKKEVPSFVFDREYMAIFEEDGGSVFKLINRVVRYLERDDFEYKTELHYVDAMLEKAKKDEALIVMGIDFGQMNDYTVITVYDLISNSLIEYSRINQVLWEDIEREIIRLNDKWNPIHIRAEENNAKATIESLQKSGLPIEGFKTTSKSKPEIINSLALAIEQKTISLPDDKTLITELSSYSMTRSPAGNIKYSAPSGLHDDIVMSLAIVYSLTEQVMKPFELEIMSV